MIAFWFLINFVFFTQYVVCRDFYMGYMYHPNSILVAQDSIYKAPPPFGFATASYGRIFKCQISYFRVVDRLGIGRGPYTKVVRGGIGKKFIAVRIKSTHKLPISVNIYVACVKREKPKRLGGKPVINETTDETSTIITLVDENQNGSPTPPNDGVADDISPTSPNDDSNSELPTSTPENEVPPETK